MNAENYEKNLEDAQKKQLEVLKASPIKNNQGYYGNGGVDSSRINQSHQKITENDVSHINGDIIKIQPKTKEPTINDISIS